MRSGLKSVLLGTQTFISAKYTKVFSIYLMFSAPYGGDRWWQLRDVLRWRPLPRLRVQCRGGGGGLRPAPAPVVGAPAPAPALAVPIWGGLLWGWGLLPAVCGGHPGAAAAHLPQPGHHRGLLSAPSHHSSLPHRLHLEVSVVISYNIY